MKKFIAFTRGEVWLSDCSRWTVHPDDAAVAACVKPLTECRLSRPLFHHDLRRLYTTAGSVRVTRRTVERPT
jgi:hypothetical protein